MNLARAILERVQEVELQVTPEFRKYPDLYYLEEAFKKNGWQAGKGKVVAPSVIVASWTHPDLDDVKIEVTYDWKKNVLVKDTISVEGGAEPGAVYPATPETVKRLTDELKSAGAAKGGAAPVKAEAWPEPMRHEWSKSPRVDYEWEDKAMVRGVRAKAHGNAYAISWPQSSSTINDNWGAAIRAIRKKDAWDRVYVYDVPEHDMGEFNDLVWKGLLYAAYYPGGGDSSDYDANVEDMLKQYVGGHKSTEET